MSVWLKTWNIQRFTNCTFGWWWWWWDSSPRLVVGCHTKTWGGQGECFGIHMTLIRRYQYEEGLKTTVFWTKSNHWLTDPISACRHTNLFCAENSRMSSQVTGIWQREPLIWWNMKIFVWPGMRIALLTTKMMRTRGLHPNYLLKCSYTPPKLSLSTFFLTFSQQFFFPYATLFTLLLPTYGIFMPATLV